MSSNTFSFVLVLSILAIVLIAVYVIPWVWQKINDAYAWARTQMIYWYVRRRVRQEAKKLQEKLQKTLPGIRVYEDKGEQWFDLSQARPKGGHHRYREYERLTSMGEVDEMLRDKFQKKET